MSRFDREQSLYEDEDYWDEAHASGYFSDNEPIVDGPRIKIPDIVTDHKGITTVIGMLAAGVIGGAIVKNRRNAGDE